MTNSSILSTSFTNKGVDASANNFIRLKEAAIARPDPQVGVVPSRAKSNRVAQVFLPPGSIFGKSTPIPKARTDAIIIGSFDPNPPVGIGFGAGFFHRYIAGPLASLATNTTVVNDQTTRNLLDVETRLKAQKKLNNGQALSRITIVAHGTPGMIHFGNGTGETLDGFIRRLMGFRLLAPGGRLVFGGCSMAGDQVTCDKLTVLAKRFNIVIQASEVPVAINSENLFYKTFHPSGKVTRNVGPFAPF